MFYLKDLSPAASLKHTIPVFIWVFREEKPNCGFLVVRPLRCSRAVTFLHVKMKIGDLVRIQKSTLSLPS